MTKSEAMRYRRVMVTGAASLSDEEALKVPMLYERWSADHGYELDERLFYNGVLYKVLQAHTSQMQWTPDVAASLYARVLIPDPGEIPEWEQPSSTNPYMKGDKVRHNGGVWISDVDNNVWEPGVFGWSPVEVE